MPRSTWKGPFSNVHVRSLNKRKVTGQDPKIWSRASMVLPVHLGEEVKIDNGKSWISVRIVEGMIGHKFGEFASTRKKTIHKFKRVQQSRKKSNISIKKQGSQ